ncbi:DUF192 domain-containing protein [Halobacillus fulvus]|nr:DUF192 domain-containing protein [Halobacillus fulvus]
MNAVQIPHEIIEATSFSTRLKGYMFKRTPPINEGILFPKCRSIHMFFVNFPLDIVFLGEQNEVIRTYSSLPPWKTTGVVKHAKATLELPAGAIDRYNIREGDVIDFKIVK